MIGRLRGVLLEKNPPSLLLDVNGVGYELDAPMTTFYTLPELGVETVLLTHLIVREDAHHLFGFASVQERFLFRQLIKVSGVGAKLAIAILSGISVSEFARCVQEDDTVTLTRVPGIGKKTAQRLIVEMRDRLDGKENIGETISIPGVSNMKMDTADSVADAVSALVALGYKPQEASRWVRNVDKEGLSREEIIRQALRMATR